MSKRLILILALAFVVGLCATSYAAVQNVKISGDLLLRAINRDNFSLTKIEKYDASGLTATTRLRLDADLTDNVGVTVRLLNEKAWGKTLTGEVLLSGEIGSAAYSELDFGSLTSSDEIAIDLAYVTLKEFLYSPMTLILGRQELRFGNALIIGDVDTNRLAANIWVPFDLSARKSFDAIRATLNYDPLIVDLIYSKIKENDLWWVTGGSVEDEDVDLYGVNAKYDLKELGITGTGEAYYFGRVNKAPRVTAASAQDNDTCNTVGVLVSGQIRKDLTGSIEGAFQFGNRATSVPYFDRNSANDIDRRAWALQGILNYALPFKKIAKYSPNVGLMYTYLSGDKTNDHVYRAWDPMFEDQTPNSIVNALFPASNVQVINAKGSFKPMEDVTFSAVYGYYRLAEAMTDLYIDNIAYAPYAATPGAYAYRMTSKKDLGHALDLTATYDYTEDVQFGLTFGYFNPGSAFNKTASTDLKHDATQLIGSMKVTF
jgi:hypothetical protein